MLGNATFITMEYILRKAMPSSFTQAAASFDLISSLEYTFNFTVFEALKSLHLCIMKQK